VSVRPELLKLCTTSCCAAHVSLCSSTAAPRLLTVVDFADEAFIENADVQSGVGRRGDGVFVTVTLIGVKPGAVGVGYSAR
jgi:hypothetical protein